MGLPAVTLTPAHVAELERGVPVLAIDDLGDPAPLGAPGRPVELVDSAGAFVAWAIADPENGVARVLSRDADDEPGDTSLRRRLAAAISLRQRLGLFPDSADRPVAGAFRLLNGEGDGVGGVLADVFGDFVVQYVLARGLRDWGRRVAEATAAASSDAGLRCDDGASWPRGILQKVRGKGSARPGKPVQSVVWGEEPPASFVVEENGTPFEIHPIAGLNVGLFTDMREHRWRIERYARGARVLNTFAYTGSLSVAAALAGAREVVSVDLSSGVLKWARKNLELAGVDPARHRFEVSDTFRFLRDAAGRGERFGLVILDPPTYSAARAASWSMRKDLPELIRCGLELVSPGGFLWFSGNSHGLTDAEIDSRLETGLIASGRGAELVETGGLPPDYPTPAAWPAARYLRVRVYRVR